MGLDSPIVCRVTRDEQEIRVCREIRHEVFVAEQQIFSDTDGDDRDLDPATLNIVGLVDAEIAGTVRIYPIDDEGQWRGDRLAVRSDVRRGHLLGQRLVRCAVATAGALGGTEMLASVQMANVAFFERLGWQQEGPPGPYHGIPHQTMRIELGQEPQEGAAVTTSGASEPRRRD